jgi:hypothetical protein
MTLQEVFNKVVTHMLTQMKQAAGPDRVCMYRAPDGTKCAIGCLIQDEDYNPRMEGRTVYALNSLNMLPDYLVDLKVSSPHFLAELQTIHDSVDPTCWKQSLQEFAHLYSLEFKDIE